MTTFTQTPSDSAGSTDSVKVALARRLAPSDAAGATDSAVVTPKRLRSASDSAGATDSVVTRKFLGFTWPTTRATARAGALTASSRDGFQAYGWPTVYAQARAITPGLGTQPGDDFYAPIELVGANGAVTRALGTYTTQVNEPGTATHTLWLRKWPPTTGAIRITPSTSSPTVAIDAWEGDAPIDLVQRLDPTTGLAEGTTSLTTTVPDIDVTAATRIRVMTSDAAAVANLTWSFIPPDGTLDLQLSGTSISQAPGVLRASVLGATPGETVRFTVVGVTYDQDIVTDSAGVLSAVGVQVVRGLLAGTHVLRAVGLTSGRVGEATFTVLNTALRPTAPAADAPPVVVVQAGVRRFVLQDPMTGGLAQYVFPVNPVSMSDPFPPKYVTPEHTTAPNGQFIMWQGAKRATPWKIAGRSTTQAHYDALVLWAGSKRRVYIHDNRNRAFLCHIEAIDLTPDPKPNQPVAHLYEIRALVYGWTQL